MLALGAKLATARAQGLGGALEQRARQWLYPLLGLWVIGAACESHETAAPAVGPAPVRSRRPPPPSSVVRALPPHAIRADGVGPFRLGQTLTSLLAELPQGPRLTLLDIPRVVHQSVMRAEQGGVLIGGEPMGAAGFVAVVGAEAARLESGIAVGATLARVEESGELAPTTRLMARDPRMRVHATLPNTKFIFDRNGILRSMVVTQVPVVREKDPTRTTLSAVPQQVTCAVTAKSKSPTEAVRKGEPRPAHLASGANVSSRDVAGPDGRLPASPPAGAGQATAAVSPRAATGPGAHPIATAAASSTGGPAASAPGAEGVAICLTPAGQWMSVKGEEIIVRAVDGTHANLVTRVRGLVWAQPFSLHDHDEILAVSRQYMLDEIVWTAALWRLDAGKLVRSSEHVLYRLDADQARWIGGTLSTVDLILEFSLVAETVRVAGFLWVNDGAEIRQLAPLIPTGLPVRRVRASESLEVGRDPAP